MESSAKLAERVLQYLKNEASARGTKSPRGTHVQLDLSRQDIATLFQMTRAEATRAINELKQSGTITVEGSTLILRE